MLKILKIIFVFMTIFIIAAGAGLFWLYETYKNEIVFIDLGDGRTKIKLEENEKDWLKKTSRSVVRLVYREATIHNPAGDFLPDQLDDNIIKEVRNKVE